MRAAAGTAGDARAPKCTAGGANPHRRAHRNAQPGRRRATVHRRRAKKVGVRVNTRIFQTSGQTRGNSSSGTAYLARYFWREISLKRPVASITWSFCRRDKKHQRSTTSINSIETTMSERTTTAASKPQILTTRAAWRLHRGGCTSSRPTAARSTRKEEPDITHTAHGSSRISVQATEEHIKTSRFRCIGIRAARSDAIR
jgi:hypothetical protein